MTLSRLERFKAAMKDDLDKIPNKLIPEVTHREAVESVSGSEEESSPTPSTETSVKHEGHEEASMPIEMLKIEDESDDSEADCFMEIAAVPGGMHSLAPDSDMDSSKSPRMEAIAQAATMKRHQITMHGESFCPILPISKFPYKYVAKAESQAVASAFFDRGQFWDRHWDLFWVWPLETPDKPVILIREEQFVQLLNEIAAKFKSLRIDPFDPYFRYIKLVVNNFPNHPRMLPRYIGRSTSRESFDCLCMGVPQVMLIEAPNPQTSQQIIQFNDICYAAVELNRGKSKASKEKKDSERIAHQAELSKQLKRAQRYLGLRAKPSKSDPLQGIPLNREEKAAVAALAIGSEPQSTIDLTKAAPHPFEDDIVIISVDIEAYERNQSMITEIGVATLDTRDLQGVAPGEGGKAWMEKIRGRHFRIHEYMMYKNHEFVQGCPDRFEFGKSEVISIKDAAQVVASCFKEPFSGPVKEEDVAATWEKLGTTEGQNVAEGKRNIVFLGHNPGADLLYLRKIGYNPLNLSNLLETMDTAGMFRAYKKEQGTRSLGNVLNELGLEGWFLHNAGNDAMYTLWAMIGLGVKEATK